MQPGSSRARPTAVFSASTTNSARWCSAIDQPTISRVARSVQQARYSPPCSVGCSVKSLTIRIPGRGAVK